MTARLYMTVFSMEVRKLMSYRLEFITNSIATFLLPLALLFYLWRAVFAESGSEIVGGYTLSGMLTYYVLVLLIGRLVRGVDYGLGLSDEVYNGQYTRYIIYPVRYFGFKYAQHLGHLSIAAVQFVLFGVIAQIAFGTFNGAGITPGTIAMALATIMVANLLHYFLYVPIEAISFWQDNVWSLNVMMRFVMGLLGGLILPLSVFPGALRTVLEWLPFRFLYSFPVRVLTGEVAFAEWAAGMAQCLVWLAVVAGAALYVWRRGDSRYTGVGI